MEPFNFDNVLFAPKFIDDDHIVISTDEDRYILERSSQHNIFVVFDTIAVHPRVHKEIIAAKFLLWDDRLMIPLTKQYQDGATTSGYWGYLPTRGQINANGCIKCYFYDSPLTYTMFYTIRGRRAEYYFSYPVDTSTIPSSCSVDEIGLTLDLSYFGL